MSGRQTAFGSYLTRFGIQYISLQHFTLLIILVCAVLKGAWQKIYKTSSLIFVQKVQLQVWRKLIIQNRTWCSYRSSLLCNSLKSCEQAWLSNRFACLSEELWNFHSVGWSRCVQQTNAWPSWWCTENYSKSDGQDRCQDIYRCTRY